MEENCGQSNTFARDVNDAIFTIDCRWFGISCGKDEKTLKVLQLTAHFRPNIGGVETHLDDLVNALTKRNWEVIVLTYRPLTTKISWKVYEKFKGLSVIRIPWIPGLFYPLVSFPLIEFIYLFPGLFITTPFVMLLSNPDVLHAHGLVAGFAGVFWGKIFRKRVVLSTHSIYGFPKKGLYRFFVKWIFNNADFSLGLSKQAVGEILSLGIDKRKVNNFTYWIDLEKFRKIENAKVSLGWKEEFVVLFVGRLIAEKGLNELLESVKSWDKSIRLIIIGAGPLEERIKQAAKQYKNIRFLGVVNQDNLPIYYSGSDILIVPSISEEGFGRVILESLACGVPVIGANRGAISEALTSEVGKIIDISPEKIKEMVEYFYNHKEVLNKLKVKCRSFAERRYSEKNAEEVIEKYSK